MCPEVTIGVGEFASKSHGFSRHRLTGEKFEVPCVGHPLGFGQVGDKAPDFSERHIIQAVVVAKLACGQYQNREEAE